jgi:hypothetical protein
MVPVGGRGFMDVVDESRENARLVVDGGTWDGAGFRSSGFPICLGGDCPPARFSLTFTKPGTYRYACLLHPAMIGTVVVT